MSFSHYIDLMIREGAVAHDLHARMLLAAHQKIVSGAQLAVAWPDWRRESGEFGLIFRIFGDPAALAHYLETVEPLSAAGLVRAYPILPVPETMRSGEVRFSRDRSHDKLSPAQARRLTRRAEKHGRTWLSTRDGVPREAGVHYLIIPSESQRQIFRLYIRRTVGSGVATGTGYGLGHAVPSF